MPDSADPLEWFSSWYDDAVRAGARRPDGMTLATVGPDGCPSARMVLYKGIIDGSFVFYTNYGSRKGQELEANPRAALVFYWDPIHRQVRVEGRVEKTSSEISDDYWRSRPRGSQLSAAASEQSLPIPDREHLVARVARLDAQYGSSPVPRPPFWGGYRVIPDVIEFWEGRTDRLHERICFRRVEGGWETETLSP